LSANAVRDGDHLTMARPRKKDGYLGIANEIVEALMATPLTGAQFRVALYVMRHTYGWDKKKHSIRAVDIADATGIPRESVHRTVRELTDRQVLARFSDSELGFQKDYDLWTVQPKKRPETKQAKPETAQPNGTTGRRDPVMDRIRNALDAITDTDKRGEM